MSPDERNKQAKTSIRYAVGRSRILQIEFNLLMIEHQGLVDIAIKLSDFKKVNIEPALDVDLGFEDIFWKWSEQSSRYYASANVVHEILLEKAKQIQGIFKALRADFEELGFDTSQLPDLSFLEDNPKDVEWDDIITGFENSIKSSND